MARERLDVCLISGLTGYIAKNLKLNTEVSPSKTSFDLIVPNLGLTNLFKATKNNPDLLRRVYVLDKSNFEHVHHDSVQA